MPKVIEIAIGLLNEPPLPIRASMDDEKLHELAVSLKRHGLLQNLVVVEDDCRYEIVAGHRRYLAAKLAGFTHLTCNVFENLADAKYGVMLDENMLREELTPAEEGMQFLDLVDKFGWSMPDLQVKFGRSEQYINERVTLVRDFPDVMKHVAAREINWSQAKAIMRCKNAKWRPYLLEQAVVHGATARTLQQYVEQFRGQDLAAEAKPALHTPEHAAILLEPLKARCIWCQRDDDQANMTELKIHSYHARDLSEFLRAAGVGQRVSSGSTTASRTA
jgi:ParB family chromosome partitioning protein